MAAAAARLAVAAAGAARAGCGGAAGAPLLPAAAQASCSGRGLATAWRLAASWQRCAAHSTAAPSGNSGGGAGRPAAEADAAGAYYRTPYHPPSPDDGGVGHRRTSARFEDAIEGALLADAVVREQLVERLGLAVHRVRLSGDRRTVYVLWDAHPGAAAAAEAALSRNAYRLRRHVARVLRSRHTPFLAFRHDHLPPAQACTAAAMERVEAEAAAEGAADAGAEGTPVGAGPGPNAGRSGGSGGGGGSSGDAGAAALEVDALASAVRELEARLPLRKRYARIVRPPRPGA